MIANTFTLFQRHQTQCYQGQQLKPKLEIRFIYMLALEITLFISNRDPRKLAKYCKLKMHYKTEDNTWVHADMNTR